MNNDETIGTLNDLIKICNDGTEGFRACAENAQINSTKLKTLLIERAHECALAAEELSALVREMHGAPATGTTAAGALHRGWLNVKATIAGKEDRYVLEECERGEDVAKLAYQKALTKAIPAPIRSVVEQQYQGVINNHNLIKRLRDEAKLAHT